MTLDVTQHVIADGLRNLGLRLGDIVIVHSSLASLGQVEGGADAVVDAFLDVVGPEGTLVVPTFGALGIITDTVKNRPNAVNSIHPKASVAAIGAQAETICADHWQADLAHGENTPYTRIAEFGGYVCLLGVDQDRNTTLHTVEELLRLPYLKSTGAVTFGTPQGTVTRSWDYFPGPHRDFIGLDRVFRDSGKMKIGTIGESVVRLIRSRDLIDLAMQLGERDPAFCLCDNPSCTDCVSQRADLARARFREEHFRLAVSSTLAGRYAEEIADACHAAGVDRVEIDSLRGLPLSRVGMSRIEKAVSILADEQIAVCGLRQRSGGAGAVRLIDMASELGIKRVVLPLIGDIVSLAATGLKKGIEISFANVATDASTVSATLAALCKQGLPATLTFSPAEFAHAGENPFLKSYRQRLRRFIDQLDVEDCTFIGESAPLAQGNGEIKELVSILRCCSFAGILVLSPANRVYPDLGHAVRAFAELLDTI